jgi:hypothetical protein
VVTAGLRPLPGRDLSRGAAARPGGVGSPPQDAQHADLLDRWRAASYTQLCPCAAFALASAPPVSPARQSPAPECLLSPIAAPGAGPATTTYWPVTLRIGLSRFPLKASARMFRAPGRGGRRQRLPAVLFCPALPGGTQYSGPGPVAQQPLVMLIRDQPGGCRSASTLA